ncbi:endonuclease domain-containing 1 protein-like [Heptranchias perlo]|uniref:endonuclease domain-containing 1 protein-like n=1 Tax=Heptranchias perlo TaxID=212740 RepID=UPI003559888F
MPKVPVRIGPEELVEIHRHNLTTLQVSEDIKKDLKEYQDTFGWGVSKATREIINLAKIWEVVANDTAEALKEMSAEMIAIRTVTLQNRMALDYLLRQAGAEVVAQFSNNNCAEFFHRGLEPLGLEPANPARLCQRYQGRYYFAGLYDRDRRIPVYSAHIYNFKHEMDNMKTGSDKKWKYEPQLADPGAQADMGRITSSVKNQQPIRQSQPVEVRYEHSYYGVSYSRGHLNPNSYHGSYTSRSATYTLTNTVPQSQAFNGGPWAQHEQKVAQLLERLCTNVVAHLVTGAISYRQDVWIPDQNEQRVAVPEFIWSAYCCAGRTSGAVLARNDGKGLASFALNHPPFQPSEIRAMSVAELEEALRCRLNPKGPVKIFRGGCQ